MQPKKSLGQNFITQKYIVEEMVRAANVSPADTVLEIGPGKGMITKELLAQAGKVIAIEADQRAVELLKGQFEAEIGQGRLILISADFLKIDLSEFLAEPYKVVANIPYYITGAIMEKVLSGKNKPGIAVFMVQKEVADRIVAKKESILSLSVKIFGTPKKVRNVGAGNFFPKPAVDSAILTISDIGDTKLAGIEEKFFFKIVRTAFSEKRKKLINNLAKIWEKEDATEALKHCVLEENTRSEDVELTSWICLAKFLENIHIKS